MASPHLRTSQIAKELGVHVNTIRLYETWGLLPEIPRGSNGYRQYTAMHLEQARLAHLSLRWPYLGDKALLVDGAFPIVLCCSTPQTLQQNTTPL